MSQSAMLHIRVEEDIKVQASDALAAMKESRSKMKARKARFDTGHTFPTRTRREMGLKSQRTGPNHLAERQVG